MTLSEWLAQAENRLSAAFVPDARLEARVLAAHVLDIERAYIVAHGEETVPEGPLEEALRRRLNREPLAYIVGFREFYGRPFRVSPAVLIPRQETEHLVEEVLRRVDIGGAKVLDVGTGSGCIGITLALERPSWIVVASDISADALSVSEANARALGASVKYLKSDLFEELPGQVFDAIVSNPPYIAEGTPLMPEVGLYEPESALYGGETGLEVYERLATSSQDHLVPSGFLFVELGHGQADDASEIFRSCGWNEAALVQDLSGISRVLVLSKPG